MRSFRSFLQSPWTVSIASNLIVLGVTAAASRGFTISSVPVYVPIAAVLASVGASALLHSRRRVRLYYTREAAYRAAVETIEATKPTRNENLIWIESLTSTTDPQKREARRAIAAIKEYESAIANRILSPDWRVRRLFNIQSIEMLQYVIKTYIDTFPTAPCYEVRALIACSASATLGPLIIGDNDVLISVAQDDGAAHACIHLHDSTIASLIKDFYRTLWEGETVTLRNSDGRNDAGIEQALLRLNLQCQTMQEEKFQKADRAAQTGREE